MPSLDTSLRNLRWSGVVLLAILLTMACGRDTTRPGVNDAPWSVGSLPPGVNPATWRVDTLPILDIGSTADDTTEWIGIAEGVAMVGANELVVADRGFAALRYFDLQGNFVRASGRKGDGPGEFQYLARLFLCGDSLVVQDIGSKKFSVFGATGHFARSYRPSAPSGSTFGEPYKMACGPAGSFLNIGWSDHPPVAEPQRIRGSAPLWLSDPSGLAGRSLGEFPGSERLAGPRGSGPHPLGKEPVLAMGRTRAYYGAADSFMIQVFDFQGNPLPAIQKQAVTLETTDADRARYRLLDTLGKSGREIERQLREWETFTFPPTVPAYTALLVDREDNLWVRMFPRSAENVVRWVVFSATGAELGTLDLPDLLTVFDIGADYVLGVATRQSDGGQQVRMYRLHRGEN